MPQFPAAPFSRNTQNLLKGITPVFTNWTTEPGTLDDLVYEEFDREITTHGVSAAAAKITYDLGRIERIIVVTDNQYSDMITWASKNAITWRQCTLSHVATFVGQYRYLEIRCGVHADVKFIKTVVYLI